MYITNVYIENIRCFKKFDISLEEDNTPLRWNLILGDNSAGKTCLLRCIAIGVCDETSGGALMKELEGDFLREKESPGIINITLKDKNNIYNIKTEITLENDREKITQSITEEDGDLKKQLFICGYGISRSGKGKEGFEKYSPLEAVYTLFNYYGSVQNPELILLRQPKSLQKEIIKILISILMLDEKEYSLDPFRLTKRGIELEQHERSILFGAWGDGYTSTVNWLTDFIGWQIYANRVKNTSDLKKLTGIVLLDEIELNLHPSWQKRIISLLREQFPHVQFIATSHSPLCALGMTDLKDKECKIFLLKNDFENVDVIEGKPPRGRRADQILTSYLFGLETSTDDIVRKEIEKYARLSAKELPSNSDIKELRRLRKILNETLGSEETELQTVVSTAIREVLQKMPITNLVNKQSIDYEIKLQLKKLLDSNDD